MSELLKAARAALLDARLPAKAGVGNGVANLTCDQVDALIDLIDEVVR